MNMHFFSLWDLRRNGLSLLRIVLLSGALILLFPHVMSALGELLSPVQTEPPDALLTKDIAWSAWWDRFARAFQGR